MTGSGGKGYLLFDGSVSDVEAAVAVALARLADPWRAPDAVPGGRVPIARVIPQLHREMRAELEAAPRFRARLGATRAGRAEACSSGGSSARSSRRSRRRTWRGCACSSSSRSTRRLEPEGQPVVAADALETAGPGELVFIVGAREAAEAMPNRFVPVDHAIVGIADAVEELRAVKLGRVVGTVVATIKAPIFEERALLLVRPARARRARGGRLPDRRRHGGGRCRRRPCWCWTRGRRARQIVGVTTGGPLRTVIVGIVDAVEGPAAQLPPAPSRAEAVRRAGRPGGPAR